MPPVGADPWIEVTVEALFEVAHFNNFDGGADEVIPSAFESNLLAGIVREERTGAYAPRPRRPERSEE